MDSALQHAIATCNAVKLAIEGHARALKDRPEDDAMHQEFVTNLKALQTALDGMKKAVEKLNDSRASFVRYSNV